MRSSNPYYSSLSIFTQAIDQRYSTKDKDSSTEYYSYEGCDIKEIDRLVLNKSAPNESDDDKSTLLVLSEEESLVFSNSNNKQSKFTNTLSDNWINSIVKLKLEQECFFEDYLSFINPYDLDENLKRESFIKNRKLTYDMEHPFKLSC